MSDRYRNRPLLHPRSRSQWRAWLSKHHARVDGAWLARWTKSGGQPPGEIALGYDEIVEEALCFGWIDGLVNTLPDGRQAHLLTPRRKGSAWSRSNKERVARLSAAGRMTEAGMTVVRAAQADGSWAMLDAAEALIEPDDLAHGLDAHPDARRHWDAFPASPRRALIWWVMSAKRPETRLRRIGSIVDEASHGRRANF